MSGSQVAQLLHYIHQVVLSSDEWVMSFFGECIHPWVPQQWSILDTVEEKTTHEVTDTVIHLILWHLITLVTHFDINSHAFLRSVFKEKLCCQISTIPMVPNFFFSFFFFFWHVPLQKPKKVQAPSPQNYYQSSTVIGGSTDKAKDSSWILVKYRYDNRLLLVVFPT